MKRLLLLLSVASAAWAQTTPPTVLPEVVVTATRVSTPALQAPAFTTLITAQQIRSSPAATLPELLRTVGGLLVASSGPEGALSTVSLRGSTSSQVLVLLDGVPLNSSRDGTVDLSQIPVDSIDHVEIVRGGESSVYGSAAVGGVINLITRRPEGTGSLRVRLENGSYLPHTGELVSEGMVETPAAADPLDLVDTQRLSAQGSTHIGKLGLVAAGGFTRAANGFVWKDSTYIDNWRRENHAGGYSGNGYLRLDAPIGTGTLSSTGSVDSTSYDVPGTLSGFGLTTHAEQQRTTAQGVVAYSIEQSADRPLGLTSHAYYQYDELHYSHPSTLPPTNSRYLTNSVGGDFSSEYRLSDTVSFLSGASARYDGLDSSDVGLRSRLNLAGFASMTLSPSDALTLTPSVRYDYFSGLPGGLSYRVGAVLALNDWSSLKGSLSDSYRVPTINDLYWPSSAYATGNPKLRPEKAVGADFGYTARSRTLSLDAAVFARLVRDEIVWAPTGDPITSPWTPENLGKALIPGAQLQGRLQLPLHLSFGVDYSFIYSFLLAGPSTTYSLSSDKRVPYVPFHTLKADLSYFHRGTRLSLDGEFVGREYTDDANSASTVLAAHTVINLSYLQSIGKRLSISFVIKNLLNAVYETQAGYPMPPFSLWTGLAMSL